MNGELLMINGIPNKQTSLRGACDEAISCNKEQIASLTLAMTED
ncbi:MAG: hypothetical protein ACK5IQ_06635 [Bacteroidales bacterium]